VDDSKELGESVEDDSKELVDSLKELLDDYSEESAYIGM